MERLYMTAKKMYECIDRCEIKGFAEILEENKKHYDADSGSIEYLACYLFNKYIEDNPENLENSEIIKMREKYDGLHKFKSPPFSYNRNDRPPFNCDERFFAVRYFAGKLLHLIFQRDKNAYVLFELLIFADIVNCNPDEEKHLIPEEYINTTNTAFLENVIYAALKYDNTGISECVIDFFGKYYKRNDKGVILKSRAEECIYFHVHHLLENDKDELRETFGPDGSSSLYPDLYADAYMMIARKKYNIFHFYKQLFIKYGGADARQAEEKAEEKLRKALKGGGAFYAYDDILEYKENK